MRLNSSRSQNSIALFLLTVSCLFAQETTNGNKEHKGLSEENVEKQKSYFEALRLRTDLRFETQKRTLYTTITDIEAFTEKFKGTDMTLDYVIRDRLHTAIFLGQKKNYLESMDGSLFDLSQNLSSKELTDEVIAVVGNMFYGSSEVEKLESIKTK